MTAGVSGSFCSKLSEANSIHSPPIHTPPQVVDHTTNPTSRASQTNTMTLNQHLVTCVSPSRYSNKPEGNTLSDLHTKGLTLDGSGHTQNTHISPCHNIQDLVTVVSPTRYSDKPEGDIIPDLPSQGLRLDRSGVSQHSKNSPYLSTSPVEAAVIQIPLSVSSTFPGVAGPLSKLGLETQVFEGVKGNALDASSSHGLTTATGC